MADIELLIKIPEEDYKRGAVTASAIRNGTILPKGHGRLIDADAISLDDIGFFSIIDYQKMVHKLTTSCQTIIEADKDFEKPKEFRIVYCTCRSLIDEIEIYRNYIEQKVRDEE